ncbi:NAD-dependent epimerase/dehydratase family protein [Sphingorhabdus arenilitoris]|uniref:NAD-dependent epimerase/dehydratase family protein n=1 Tax=Sphingorhabdus arenilitoris TaxID=1490041 RepID=A0ABV8RIE7_9SPHN
MPMGVVALTGATGFVGKTTIERLIEAGWNVRALTRREQPAKSGVTWVRGSLQDRDALLQLCDGADAVLHIAGVVNAPDKAGFEAGNVSGTDHMIEAAKAQGIRRFVHVSSLSAREPALSLYGASKMRGEKLVATSLLDWTIVRPPGVYGPGDTEMLDIFRMAAKGFALLPPRGKVSLIHVDDLARLLTALLPAHEDATAQIYEADDGKVGGWTHSGFARAIGWGMGKRVSAVHAPRPLLFAAAYGDRLLRRDKAKLTPDRASYLAHRDWTIDPARRPPAALWQPQIDTRAGVKETARWYRAQGWLK